jgi:elongation factor Ts
MTQISASMVKELREKTGAGMMDCKNALEQAGSMEGAIKVLREKGLAKAAKKSSRIASEGLISISVNNEKACMIELNCETDFVARNDDFKKLANDLVLVGLNFDASSIADTTQIEGSLTNTESLILEKIAQIGEKISFRRFAKFSHGDVYGSYLHTSGNIGVLVECQLNDKSLAKNPEVIQAAKDLAMHIAASNPAFIQQSDIDNDWKTAERDIFAVQVKASGKPEAMIDKIVDGKMAKHMQDHCLLDQPFIKNPDLTVAKMLQEIKNKTQADIKITKMVRYKVGEGIDKKEDNFLDEVKKMVN